MSPALARLCLAGAMLTVGSTVVAGKLIGNALPPFTAAALRFALALPCFLLLLRGRRWFWPDRHDACLLVLQALAGSAGYTVLLLLGMRWSPGADAGIMLGALPAMAALIAWLILGERPAASLIAGIVLATAGVALVMQTSLHGAAAGHLLVLAAIGCEALFILLNKRLHRPLPALAQAAAMTLLGLVLTLPGALYELPDWPALDAAALPLAAVLFYALVPTVCGFWLWYAGAARLSGSEAAVYTALAPVAAVLLSAGLLNESVSGFQGLGLGLVILAVLLPASGLARQRKA